MGLLSKPLRTILPLVASGAAALAGASSVLPYDKIYGVNLGMCKDCFPCNNAYCVPLHRLVVGTRGQHHAGSSEDENTNQ